MRYPDDTTIEDPAPAEPIYPVQDPEAAGPIVPPELMMNPGTVSFGGVAPLPAGTANANFAAQGIQTQPIGDVNYSEADKRLIRLNEDDRLVAMGINPVAYRKAKGEAEAQANQMQGLLGYQRDVAAGVPHAQALLKNSAQLFAKNPAHLADAVEKLSGVTDEGGSVSATPVYGAKGTPLEGKLLGHEYKDRLGRSRNFIPTSDKPSATEVATRAVLRDELRSDRSRLAALERDRRDVAKSAMNPDLDAQIAALTQKIAESTAAYTGAKTAAPAQEKSAIPFKEGAIVRNKKTGKVYKIVHGEPVEQ